MKIAFLPIIAVSAAAVGAIIYGFVKRGSGNKNKNDGGNFKSDGQAKDLPNNRF